MNAPAETVRQSLADAPAWAQRWFRDVPDSKQGYVRTFLDYARELLNTDEADPTLLRAQVIACLHQRNDEDGAPVPAETITSIVDLALYEMQSRNSRQIPHRNVLDLRKLARTSPPEFRWIIRHWLSWHPTLLAALGGMGKTLLAIMIGVALASGRSFLGPACDPVRVLLWLCEDDQDEIHRRLAAVCAYFDVDMASLAGWLVIDARRGLENTLYTTDFGKPAWTPEIEELRQQVNDYHADVLVLDNIAQIFAANPNAPHDTTAFINGIVGLVLDRPFCPIFVGHTARGIGSEYANSAAWENAVRMRWYLGDKLPGEKVHEDEEPDPNTRVLARRKANYTGKDFVRFTFKNGVLVPEVHEQESDIVHHLYEKRARAVVLDAMAKLAAMGRTMSDARGGNYLPKLILQYRLADGLGIDDLERAMRAAQTDGEIVRGEVGRYANRTPKIGLVVAGK